MISKTFSSQDHLTLVKRYKSLSERAILTKIRTLGYIKDDNYDWINLKGADDTIIVTSCGFEKNSPTTRNCPDQIWTVGRLNTLSANPIK